VGTTATALLSSIGTTREGKQVALAHVLFKVLGVLVFIPFTLPFTKLVATTSSDVTRQIANAHTLFNVGITLVFLPFVSFIAILAQRLIPKSSGEESLATPKYLDRQALSTPSLAVDQAEQEVMRVAEIVRRMVLSIGNLIVAWEEKIVSETHTYEDAVDSLCVDISHYLSDASQNAMPEEESRRIVRLLHVLNDLEHIGDCMVGLAHLAQKKITSGLNFSDPGQQEMIGYYNRVRNLFENAMQALVTGDAELAKEVLDAQAQAISEERTLRERHIGRLQAGLSLSRETSSIHLDALIGLRRIADHAAGIAHTVRDGHKGSTLVAQSEWTAELKAIQINDAPQQTAEG
jgi:phosphate:Na+ symporter